MVEADGLVELPEDMTHLRRGTDVDFLALQRGVVVKILYFAWLRSKTGVAEEDVEPPAKA